MSRRLCVIIVLGITLLSKLCESDSADAGKAKKVRPFEFGYSIEGNQHRHEKRDENGIVMGEFGFITADGIYHVTVYATDENGKFKIISMKNFPYGNPPKKMTIVAMLPESKKLVVMKPMVLDTRSCSGCTLTKAVPQQPADVGKPVTAKTAGGSKLPNIPQPVKPFKSNKFPSNADMKIILESVKKVSGKTTGNRVSSSQALDTAVGVVKKMSGSRKEDGKKVTSAQGGGNFVMPTSQMVGKGFKNELLRPDQKSSSQPKTNPNPISSQLPGTTSSGAPSPEDGATSKTENPTSPGSPGSQNKPPSQVSPLNPSQTRSKMPSAGTGGPLYRFNYILDYNSHLEEGQVDGTKEGNYKAIDEDGIRRITDYLANENGYQPHIKWQRVPESELPTGENRLKDYEFVWFNTPA